MKKQSNVVLAVILVVVFAAGIGLGIFIQNFNAAPPSTSTDAASEFQLVQDAWNIVRTNYVDTTATQPKTLAYGTIGGMVDSLGDTGHSSFLTPEELNVQNNFIKGQIQGIGVEVQEKNGNVVIIAPIDGSPAQKAGLRSGDIILKVNGETLTDVTQAVNLILGPAGTSVTLTIQNVSGATRDVTITRAVINIVSVTWHMLPGSSVAHLRISSFSQGVSADLDSALTAINNQGATAIILDMRDNPGGLLDEAVGVASRFISSGNVLLEKDINGKVTSVPVNRGVRVSDLPMAVLVNQGTASAAEIVTGALQDAGRARIIGETTFGTGTVLSRFSLPDGSALILAVQEWLTPSGRTIWHKGLTPDDVVALVPTATILFPEGEQGLTAADLQSSTDKQLLQAYDYLTTKK